MHDSPWRGPGGWGVREQEAPGGGGGQPEGRVNVRMQCSESSQEALGRGWVSQGAEPGQRGGVGRGFRH